MTTNTQQAASPIRTATRNDWTNPSLTVDAFKLCAEQFEIAKVKLEELSRDPVGKILIYTDELLLEETLGMDRMMGAAFGLYFIGTAAQRLQLGISQFTHGRRGSGRYFNTLEESHESILQHLQYFHRTTPFAHKLAELRAKRHVKTVTYGWHFANWSF